MSQYFPEKLSRALAVLPADDRDRIVAGVRRRLYDPQRYEVALLFLGWCGLHRVYLRDYEGAFARALVSLSALTLLYTGCALVSLPILAGGVAFILLQAGLWVRDWRRLDYEV